MIAPGGLGSGKVSVAGGLTLGFSVATSASRHLVIAGSTNVAISTITDSGSGSWTVKEKLSTVGAGAPNERAFIAYSENRAATTTQTINFSGSAFAHATLDPWSGVKTSGSFDQQVDAEGAVSTNAWASGNLTAPDPNCLIYGAAHGNDSSIAPWTAPGGAWTEIFQDGDTSVNVASEVVYQIASGSTGPFSATFTYTDMVSGGFAGASLLVSFLPSNLPTVTVDPRDKNTVFGTSATFSVAAVASAGALHYQWKKAGVNAGTDSPTYTTDPTTSSDQRADIYCVVTDDNGSVDSGHATLTLSWHDVYLYAMPEDTDPDDVRLRDPTAFAATGAFTLTLTAGVYTLVGNSINLRATRQLVLTKGEYTFTGKSIGLAFGARVTGTKGVYTLVGNSINLRATRQLLITAGVYRLVGNNIDLRAGRQLALTKGVYSLVGNNIDLRATRQLILTVGRYTLNGNDITLTKTASNSLELTQGQYRLTGNDIILRATRQLILTAGRYELVGQSITLSAGRQLILTAGRYELVGKDITLRAARVLVLTQGRYELVGKDINLDFAAAGAHTLTLTQGRYTLTGNPVELTAQQITPAPAADDFTQAKYGGNVKFRPLKPGKAVIKAPLPAQITNMPGAPILAPRRGPLMEILETLGREPLLRKPPPPEAPEPTVAVVKPKPKPAPKPKVAAVAVEAPPAIDYEAAMRALHESHEREREELEAQLASLQARLALADAMAEAQRERARIEQAEAERVAEKRRKNQRLAARLSAELLSDDN